jgi:hypothetical protein
MYKFYFNLIRWALPKRDNNTLANALECAARCNSLTCDEYLRLTGYVKSHYKIIGGEL